ncbi:hypothetical protein E8E12_005967 [Didymella heteroderae]|uniref:GPI anchored serine-threonine rich protein n=1 Tax=Didymella heteroderae TaxID=1769908 RepID=A0A9P4WK24_9PLEO|nr:hypothetical protein E8E12_005967 [Didymella heteroderae]
MFKPTIFLPLLTAAVVSADMSALLVRRQTIPVPCSADGRKDCGSGCIDATWTCCPSGAGGCPPTAYCSLGSNGLYGCCPLGEDCEGDGGSRTTGGGIIVSVSTTTIIDDSTSTIIDDSTSTIVDDSTSTTTEDVTSTLTSTATSTVTGADDESSTSTLTLTSTSALTLTSVSPPPVLPSSHTSTLSSNVTTGSPTAPTSPPEFTGGAHAQAQDIAGWLLAMALPLFVL